MVPILEESPIPDFHWVTGGKYCDGTKNGTPTKIILLLRLCKGTCTPPVFTTQLQLIIVMVTTLIKRNRTELSFDF